MHGVSASRWRELHKIRTIDPNSLARVDCVRPTKVTTQLPLEHVALREVQVHYRGKVVRVEEIKRLFFAQKRAPEIRLSFRNSSGRLRRKSPQTHSGTALPPHKGGGVELVV